MVKFSKCICLNRPRRSYNIRILYHIYNLIDILLPDIITIISVLSRNKGELMQHVQTFAESASNTLNLITYFQKLI